jgi:hypothetical protein
MQRSPIGPLECDAASTQYSDFNADKFSFSGAVTGYPEDEATIQAAIMSDGPVEAAFTVYSDFETYESGICKNDEFNIPLPCGQGHSPLYFFLLSLHLILRNLKKQKQNSSRPTRNWQL